MTTVQRMHCFLHGCFEGGCEIDGKPHPMEGPWSVTLCRIRIGWSRRRFFLSLLVHPIVSLAIRSLHLTQHAYCLTTNRTAVDTAAA